MRRLVHPTLFAVSTVVGLVLATVGWAQVVRPPPTRPSPPTVSTRAPVKVATNLEVADLQWTRGQTVNVFAVLRSSLRRAVPRAAVRLSVAGREICTPQTDAYGRVACNYAIGAAADGAYPVSATYGGSDHFAASTGAGTLTVSRSGYGGGLSFPGAPTVQFSPVHGAVDFPTRMRAAVVDSAGPVAGRYVEFRANGEALAASTTDAAGIAAVDYRPRVSKLRRLHHSNPSASGVSNYLGGFQAWLLPRRGTTDAVVAVVAQGAIIRFPEPCAAYVGPVDGYPQRCASASAEPATMTVQHAPSFTVEQGRFGSATRVSTGRFTIEAPQPPNPPPNADCNARTIDVPDACRRTCSRLEYRTYDRRGSLAALRGQSPARCGWALEVELAPEEDDFARGHDACARAAATAGRDSWNHQVTITVPIRVDGHFQFRDPHTQRTANGWRYALIAQHEFRTMWVQGSMQVSCR